MIEGRVAVLLLMFFLEASTRSDSMRFFLCLRLKSSWYGNPEALRKGGCRRSTHQLIRCVDPKGSKNTWVPFRLLTWCKQPVKSSFQSWAFPPLGWIYLRNLTNHTLACVAGYAWAIQPLEASLQVCKPLFFLQNCPGGFPFNGGAGVVCKTCS